MMRFHVIKAAYRNLESTTLRTILAMLGILVGTAAVVAMVSTGQMATDAALAEFKTLGTELIAVSISSKNSDSEGASVKKFDLNDAMDIKRASMDINEVAPYTIVFAPISYMGNSIEGAVIGATNTLQKVVNIKIKYGRFISELDHYEKYAVVGYKLYKQLQHYTREPLLTRIQLGDQIYTIIGVENTFPENAFLYQDINSSLIVPIRTSAFLAQYNEINNVVMRLKPDANIQNVKTAIGHYIAVNVPNKEIFFRSAQELIRSMAAQHQIFTLLLSLIGGISLLVGGIGVMNIMLVSVLERRREIGVRLALGARRVEIQHMFLVEAIMLSVIGGLLGILTGIAVSFIIAIFSHWHFKIFLLPPLIGFTVSGLIGIFFGYYPARKAAELDPIQTLRIE